LNWIAHALVPTVESVGLVFCAWWPAKVMSQIMQPLSTAKKLFSSCPAAGLTRTDRCFRERTSTFEAGRIGRDGST
jgi:hypothetical protein